MQYKTIVMNSTVGLNAAGLNFTEFSNLQAYVRAGGGVIAIHGATDSMQNVPWYMDLVGAGFTNHGSNAGGILIDTESGGHVELVNADPGSTATAAMPDRFFTVDELYNTNRNPVGLGIVHPLVYENEDTLVGQLGYSTGALMNTDQHAMVWCRNFDGGRSFTTTLSHSWQFMTETWFQQQMLAAVKWTAGVGYLNCVTYNEVSELLATASAANVSPAGSAALSALLAEARTEFDAGTTASAARMPATSSSRRRRSPPTARTRPACPDAGAALAKLASKGQELIAWAKGLESDHRSTGPAATRSPPGLVLSAGDCDPAARPGRLRNRIAEEDLLVPVGKGREVGLGRHRPRQHRPVDGAVELLERVREPLRVPAGIVAAHRPAHQRGVAHQLLVRAVAVAEPELLVPLGTPGERTLGAVDLEGQVVLAAGADLRDHNLAAGAVLVAEQNVRDVLGLHRPVETLDRAGVGIRLDGTLGTWRTGCTV